MTYQVRVGAHKPEVIDAAGNVVPNPVVHGITFPSGEQHGPNGISHVIFGPGRATATVGGSLLTGLPLC